MYFHTFGKKYFKWADKILKCIKPIIYTQYHPESAYHSILYRLIYINRTNISSICIEKKQTSQLIWGGGRQKLCINTFLVILGVKSSQLTTIIHPQLKGSSCCDWSSPQSWHGSQLQQYCPSNLHGLLLSLLFNWLHTSQAEKCFL